MILEVLNTTFGPTGGNLVHNPMNVVQYSAN